MRKNRIRLSESQLHRVIKESVSFVFYNFLYVKNPKRGGCGWG